MHCVRVQLEALLPIEECLWRSGRWGRLSPKIFGFPDPITRKAERRARKFTVEFKCEMHTKF